MNKENGKRELLFSVTANDCKWAYTKGTGSGGQKKNKTSSAVHCTHPPSGAHGYAEDDRSQRRNRELAFERMANSAEFKKWHKIEVARRTGRLAAVEDAVNREMKKIRVEIKKEGIWTEVDKNDPLSDVEETDE